MRIHLITAAAALLISGQAFAATCPVLVTEIDAAPASSTASARDMLAAKALRDEGEALHAAGDHATSVEKPNEAKALLGLWPGFLTPTNRRNPRQPLPSSPETLFSSGPRSSASPGMIVIAINAPLWFITTCSLTPKTPTIVERPRAARSLNIRLRPMRGLARTASRARGVDRRMRGIARGVTDTILKHAGRGS